MAKPRKQKGLTIAYDPTRIAQDATEKLAFRITKEHIKRAVCGDPSKCVVAQGVNAHFGPMIDGISVGSHITKIYMPGREVRFTTSKALRTALVQFDKTGQWNLPEGTYTLHPPVQSERMGARSKRKGSWVKRKSGGVQSKFKGTDIGKTDKTSKSPRAPRTRTVIRVSPRYE